MNALLRDFSLVAAPPMLRGEDVYLRMPVPGDYAQWSKLRDESRDFLEPWEPAWSADALSRAAFRRRLRRYARELREDQGIAFLIFRRSDDALVGGITLSDIRRGVTQSCSVGYWTGKRYARRGFMYGALTLVVRFVFDELRLHRLEAACVPTNVPSISLLQKIGFSFEGLAREYLCINGVWRDHKLFALLSTDPRSPLQARLRAANSA
ncbi:MAG: N-acetyltransferase [Alphaproteobacteria bacterium]|nr:N-acetyltransferase [Alphaproteobacteria bacterium]